MKHTDQGHEPQIITVIAELLIQFNMDFEIFSKALRSQYVIDVYNSCHSFSRTALKCGIDRRIVASTIKGEKLYNKRPILHIIIEAIKHKAQHNNGTVAKYGIDSLSNIIDNHVNGATTTKSVIDVLTQSGMIQDDGESFTVIDHQPVNSQADQHIQALITDLTQSIEQFKAAIQHVDTTTDNYKTSALLCQ